MCLQFFHGHGPAQLFEHLPQLLVAPYALFLDKVQDALQLRIGGIHAVAQDVHIVGAALETGHVLRVFRGELHAPHDLDAQPLSFLYGFLHAAHAVVVRNGHHVDAHALRALHDHGRGLLPVAVIRMQMKIRIVHL